MSGCGKHESSPKTGSEQVKDDDSTITRRTRDYTAVTCSSSRHVLSSPEDEPVDENIMDQALCTLPCGHHYNWNCWATQRVGNSCLRGCPPLTDEQCHAIDDECRPRHGKLTGTGQVRAEDLTERDEKRGNLLRAREATRRH
jgi:hypothetical protein